MTEQPAGLPFFVGLMVRAGWADETLKTCGLTHLVEHLALPARHVPELELNGVVQDAMTLFWFSGEKDDAVAELVATTQALRTLPLDRLESERSILFTEEEQRSSGLVPLMKSLRFGAQGHGLAHYDEHALRWVERDDVAAWAARHFTRANACLYVVGELPDDIDLALPQGERIAAPAPAPIDYVRYPSAFTNGPPSTVGVSFLARRSVALMTALRILEVRLRDTLRHQHGVTYSTDWAYDALTGEHAHVVVWADAQEANVDRARNVFLTVLDELAFAGPTAEELARDSRRFREQLFDPLNAANSVYTCADNELLRGEQTTAEELLAELEALDSRDVAQALAEAAQTMLLCLPQEAAVVGGRFTEYPMNPPAQVMGKRWKRRRSFRRGAEFGPERELVVGPDGVTLVAEQFTSTVRYVDCVGMLRLADGRRGLWSADGFYIYVDPAIWRDGEKIVAEIDSGVPAEVVIPSDGAGGDPDLAAGEAAFFDQRWSDAIDLLRRGLEREPEHAVAWVQLAFALEAEHRYAETLEAADRAVAADGRLPAAHRARARGLHSVGRPLEAAEAMRTALSLDPSDLEVLSDYAWLVGELGDGADAMRVAQRAVELYPNEGAAWFALAAASDMSGDPAREEEALRKVLELEPNVPMWHNNLGWFLLRRGRTKEALASFDRALKLDRNMPLAPHNRAVALALLGRHDEADKANAELRRRELVQTEGDLARNPDDVDSRSSRVTTLLKLGQLDEARAELTALEERARATARPDRLFDAAAFRLDVGDREQARRLFDEAFAASPETVEAPYYRAYVGAHYDDPDATRRGADRFRELYPSHPYATDVEGYAAYTGGDPAGAAQLFAETRERRPLRCCSHAWQAIATAGLGQDTTELLGRARILCMRGGVHCASLAKLRGEE